MSSWLDTIVSEFKEYNRVDEMKELCDRVYADDDGTQREDACDRLCEWIEEMLDMGGIPEGEFRKHFIREYYYNMGDCATNLIDHIWEECGPEQQKECSENLTSG